MILFRTTAKKKKCLFNDDKVYLENEFLSSRWTILWKLFLGFFVSQARRRRLGEYLREMESLRSSNWTRIMSIPKTEVSFPPFPLWQELNQLTQQSINTIRRGLLLHKYSKCEDRISLLLCPTDLLAVAMLVSPNANVPAKQRSTWGSVSSS